MQLNAGIDCIRAFNLDPYNFACRNTMNAFLSLVAFTTHEIKPGSSSQYFMKSQREHEIKIRSQFLDDLKKKAINENIKGTNAFFEEFSK
jgi:hypothetical protein